MAAVKEIVRLWLEANGYDGLFNENGECGCTLDDLAPCGEMSGDCRAGYKVTCRLCTVKDTCGINQDCYSADWIITDHKGVCKRRVMVRQDEQ